MAEIILETFILAPPEICYDLSLSLDVHQMSTAGTKEHIVDGVKEGIMKPGETVTWRARHFGIWFTLCSKITEAKRPTYFVDEMQKGPFKSLEHAHYFNKKSNGTLMKDIFKFESPVGILGKVADVLVLKNYLMSFLTERNRFIKETAESGRWQEILSN